MGSRLWGVIAAFASTYPPRGPLLIASLARQSDEQFEHAIGQQDEHAIKLADALWTLEEHGASERVLQVGQRIVSQLRW